LLGYDVSHHHGEGLRAVETQVHKPKESPRKAESKWFSRKTLETYGHTCTAEKDKNTAKLVETLEGEFNSIYLKTYD
jgi:hypothetical protein